MKVLSLVEHKIIFFIIEHVSDELGYKCNYSSKLYIWRQREHHGLLHMLKSFLLKTLKNER